MADVVGSVAYEVMAEFDAAQFNESVAKGLDRTRDSMGRFVKEYRTVGETVMADLGNVFSSGTKSAVSVLRSEMMRAADLAGSGFMERLGAALGSVPSSVGKALSTGLISTVSAGLRSAGDAASEAFAERIRKSTPTWKAAFGRSFAAAADEGTMALVGRVRAGVDNSGREFTRLGAVASAQLGDALAKAANTVAPAMATILDSARDMGAKLSARLSEAGTKAMDMLASGIQSAATKLAPIIQNVTTRAGSLLESGLEKAGDLGRRALELPFGAMLGGALGVALAGAITVGGVKLVAGATKAGVEGAKALGSAMASGLGALGSMLGSAIQAAGSAIMSAVSAIGKGAAQAFGDALKLGVSAVGASVATILGVSLTKGLGRLKAIDNAEASLRGLAATADHVPEIMDAATNAVTGTAFGLDQAASAAAQFAAAGVPIEDMESRLSALANTAAAAGGDFDGMSDIFAKVAARGNVTGEVLNQLTSRGVSGLNALAEHFGKSTEEVQAMVSAGEVGFEDFSEAMDKAMGSVAIEQATTFSGLMSNVGAAMGRLGAVMEKPFFDATKAVLPGVINLFDQFKNVVEPLADIIADRLIPFAERIGGALEDLDFSAPNTSAKELFGTLGALAPVIGGLAATFAGPLLQNIPVVGSLFSGLTGPVGILAGAMVALFAIKPETLMAGMENILGSLPGMLEGIVEKVADLAPMMAERFAQNAPMLIQGFAQAFEQVASSIGAILPILIPVAVDAVVTLAKALVGAVPTLISAGVDLLSGLARGLLAALPVLIKAIPELVNSLLSAFTEAFPMLIEAGVGIINALLDGLLEALPELLAALPEMITGILEALVEALPLLIAAGVDIILSLVEGVVEAIPQIIAAITELLPVLLEALVNMLPALIQGGIALFLGLVNAVVEAIPQIITALLDLLPELIQTLVGMIPSLVSGAIELFLGIMIGLVQAIPDIIMALIDMLPQILSTLLGMLPQLIEAAINLFLGIVDGIAKATGPIVLRIGKMGVEMVNKVISFVSGFKDAAGDLIDGLIQGIKDGASAVWNAVTDLAASAVDGFKDFLGIASPSKVMRALGENMGDGLVDGLDSMQSAVSSSLDSLIPPALSTGDVQVGSVDSVGDRMAVGGAGAGVGGFVFEAGSIVIQGAVNPEETAIHVVDQIAEMVGM